MVETEFIKKYQRKQRRHDCNSLEGKKERTDEGKSKES